MAGRKRPGRSRITNAAASALNVCGSVMTVTCYAGFMGMQKTYGMVMGKPAQSDSSEKSEDLNFLEDVFKSATSSLPEIREQVQALMQQEVEKTGDVVSQSYLADTVSTLLIKRSALQLGASGGLSSAAGILPGVGGVISSIAGVSIDLYWLLRTQVELCYAIAAAYDVEMEDEELQAVSVALLGYSNSVGEGAGKSMVRESVNKAAKGYMRSGLGKASLILAEKIGMRINRVAARFIPFFGIPLGASINIASTVKVGRLAKKYFTVCSLESIQ